MEPFTIGDKKLLFRVIDDFTPRGRKILLLTETLVCVIGAYGGESSYIGWFPLPEIPEMLKEKENKNGNCV